MTVDLQSLRLSHRAAAPRQAPTTGKRPPLLLLLHGFGSNEEDLFAFAPYVDPRFAVVSARAPVAMGQGSHAWFSLRWTAEGKPIANEVEAAASLDALMGFLPAAAAEYGADPARIYLAGFSQGAIMSLSIALLAPQSIAGAVLMSGRLPLPAWERRAPDAAFTGLPVFVAHGVRDAVLPIADGRAIRDALTTLPVDLTYREYEMAHEVSPDSLRDITGFLTRRLDDSEESGNGS